MHLPVHAGQVDNTVGRVDLGRPGREAGGDGTQRTHHGSVAARHLASVKCQGCQESINLLIADTVATDEAVSSITDEPDTLTA